MSNLRIRIVAAALMLSFGTGRAANITLDAPPDVPTGLDATESAQLSATRKELLNQLVAARELISHQSLECSAVEAGSAKESECRSMAAAVGVAVKRYRAALANFRADRITRSMKSSIATMGFDPGARKRVTSALNDLDFDGDVGITGTQIRQAWQSILPRSGDATLALAAGHGEGPAFAGAGRQSFQDCALFAIANATNQPYAVVAAQATRLIGAGPWRDEDDHAHPQRVLEQEGLMGGEVVMLAETFGQVEVIPSSGFAATLAAGRPVLVNVVPTSGDVSAAHEVVLTRTFQYEGATWYEMMDSNQAPEKRLYLSGKELGNILQEKGVAYRPEPGTVPRLFR